jgi:hypothetical protein
VDIFDQTETNQVRRKPKRGFYDKETLYKIIDEALLCHVGFVDNGQPFVMPTIHARDGDRLYLHGANASRMLKHIQTGEPVCVSIALLDGIIFARSAFEHSYNYRSVVLFGRGKPLETRQEKLQALEILTEHIARGRWNDVRRPNPKELDATTVVAIDIESASAKIHEDVPADNEEDYRLPVWAGVLPLRLQALDPVDDGRLLDNVTTPGYLSPYKRIVSLLGVVSILKG